MIYKTTKLLEICKLFVQLQQWGLMCWLSCIIVLAIYPKMFCIAMFKFKLKYVFFVSFYDSELGRFWLVKFDILPLLVVL